MKKSSRTTNVTIPKRQKSQKKFCNGRTYEYSDDNTPSRVNSASKNVLLTSGSPFYTILEDPVLVAQELRHKGITLNIVGIPFNKEAELLDLGGTAENVFIRIL